MSAFNEVGAEVPCTECGRSSFQWTQFKFGDTWQHRYRVGDRLKWGGNDVGSPGYRCVLVAGLAGPCPFCQADNLEYEVVMKDDVISGVKPAFEGGAHTAEDGFMVVE